MKKMKILTVLLLLGMVSLAFGQSSVSGTVTDENDIPLPGATVVEKGSINGTTTDFDGNFVLDLSSSNAVLEVSYIATHPRRSLSMASPYYRSGLLRMPPSWMMWS